MTDLFVNPARASLAATIASVAFAATSAADITVDSSIERIKDTTTVDYINFSVLSAGDITIDLLSWEAMINDQDESRGEFYIPVDVNMDGDISFFDTTMFLFSNDGMLTLDDLLANNDDDSFANPLGMSDGSIDSRDSYLAINLAAGDYILAVGAFSLSAEDAIAGINTTPFPDGPWTINEPNNLLGSNLVATQFGDYRATLLGDVVLTSSEIPLPTGAGLGLLGFTLIGGLSVARRRRSSVFYSE